MVSCPACKTSYLPAVLGLDLSPTTTSTITVQCAVCKSVFNASLEPETVFPTTYERLIRGKKPEVRHKVTALLRERR